MTVRYAIYYTPAQHSRWWEFGSRWLGRDECRDELLAQPVTTLLATSELFEITSEPRRYGFHATLKAPFPLRESHSEDDVVARMQTLARTLQPVALGKLQARLLGNFVALVPSTPTNELQVLAAACVTELDDLRAPMSDAEHHRRNAAHLDMREKVLLDRYGYPYVLDRFRMHFTLSGPVSASTADRVLHSVASPLNLLNSSEPLVLDRLCLFVEPAPGHAFRRVTDVELPT